MDSPIDEYENKKNLSLKAAIECAVNHALEIALGRNEAILNRHSNLIKSTIYTDMISYLTDRRTIERVKRELGAGENECTCDSCLQSARRIVDVLLGEKQ